MSEAVSPVKHCALLEHNIYPEHPQLSAPDPEPWPKTFSRAADGRALEYLLRPGVTTYNSGKARRPPRFFGKRGFPMELWKMYYATLQLTHVETVSGMVDVIGQDEGLRFLGTVTEWRNYGFAMRDLNEPDIPVYMEFNNIWSKIRLTRYAKALTLQCVLYRTCNDTDARTTHEYRDDTVIQRFQIRIEDQHQVME